MTFINPRDEPRAQHARVSHPSRLTILRTATALFAARGVEGVTMRAIATASGLHLPSIYHFFANKKSLYAACTQAVFEDAAAVVGAALAEQLDRGADEAAASDAFAGALAKQLVRDPALLLLACREHLRHPGWLADSALAQPMDALTAIYARTSPCAAARLRTVQLVARELGLALTAQIAVASGGARRRAGGTRSRQPAPRSGGRPPGSG